MEHELGDQSLTVVSRGGGADRGRGGPDRRARARPELPKILLPTPRPTPRPRRDTGSRAPAAPGGPRAPGRRAARRSGAATGAGGGPRRPRPPRAREPRPAEPQAPEVFEGSRSAGSRRPCSRPAARSRRGATVHATSGEARVGERRLPQDEPLDRRERRDDPGGPVVGPAAASRTSLRAREARGAIPTPRASAARPR